ncbi:MULTISPECIES: helix-turn-helix domain-containing protein [Bacillus]|uniref:helix-turn-helix domain-containing protein n=1 Tax=Bacillus TaxID=1386 RepID=UPI0003471094|nr:MULTISPECIES: helix-turn-helix transcriptional regulator [Bacillus cereus group]PEB07796.1 XRE family transcriptional regulator [Bacillus cereus]AWC31835.1 XRE family transcriptional regulator [Bacillus cytotoxicus]AWC35873.1 XRE family transcriptional regulator [Bacillus cytotoxicus]AWC60113.1 XRE family transcriptional regulator [Bacillus cytotoxicus]KMT50333.1 Cro/Cl family transcriptional regulator [Bacillus cytotoxicus]
MTLVNTIKSLCAQRKIAISALERDLGFGNGTIRRWDNTSPSADKLQKVADYFHVTTDYLLGREQLNQLGNKDEKDIEKRMEEIKRDLKDSQGLMFSGEPMSEEAVDSLLDAMEYIVRQTKVINKKYIPKKHRKDN